MASTESRPQCWECQRRRLVCDSTSPVCNQCRTRRITCPGYENKKPLVWLAPGRVRSKAGRPLKGTKSSNPKASKSGKGRADAEHTPDLASSMTQTGQQRIPEVPKFVFKTERCDIYGAAHYYNEAIYPELTGTLLGPTWFILPSIHLYIEVLPPSIRHVLIAMVFSHHILHRPGPQDMSLANPDVRGLHEHRLLGIQSLNAEISDPIKCKSDMTIKSVLMFLLQELQQSTLPTWREHLHGLIALLDQRGGLMEYIRTSQDTKTVMVSMSMLIVFSNATGPPDQQTMGQEHFDHIDTVLELYDRGPYPNCPCPTDIFACLIRINHLRYQISQLNSTTSTSQLSTMQITAEEVLASLLAFKVEEWNWIEPDCSYLGDWFLSGRIFQSSAILFLIHTLRGIFPLDRRRDLQLLFIQHRDNLRDWLTQTKTRPRAWRGTVWALIVAGVSSHANIGKADDGLRELAAEQLERMSRVQGSASHIQARTVLQKFWDSGGRTWDECFDKPYALVI